MNGRQWARDITGARTAAVLVEYLRLWEMVENVQLQPNVPDRVIWKWTSGGVYSSSSAYQAFFLGRTVMPGAREL